jgi:DNA-binding transcriptional LysR family regulator
VLLAPAGHPIVAEDEIRWSQAAKLPLCALTPAMRNRRIIDGNMAADGARFHPVMEADTVGALFAHLAGLELATVASHTWLHAFGVPDGLAARPMVQHGEGPAVGLIVLEREPNSIVAEALVSAAGEVDFAGVLQAALDRWVRRPTSLGAASGPN